MVDKNYPEIVILFIEKEKLTKPESLILDPDWVTDILFTYQSISPELIPISETHQKCLQVAENIKPRSEWNITQKQKDMAGERYKEKWMTERKKYAQRF